MCWHKGSLIVYVGAVLNDSVTPIKSSLSPQNCAQNSFSQFRQIINVNFKNIYVSFLQPVPPAPLQEVSVVQDPLGATQTLDPTLLNTGDPPTPREESTELPLLEHLRWVYTGRTPLPPPPKRLSLQGKQTEGPSRPGPPQTRLVPASRSHSSNPHLIWLSATALLLNSLLQYSVDSVRNTPSLSANGIQNCDAELNTSDHEMISATCFFQSQNSSWLTRPVDYT